MLKMGRIPEEVLPRCSTRFFLGAVGNVVLAAVLFSYDVDVLAPHASYGAESQDPPRPHAEQEARPDLSALNVRLSTRPIRPPEDDIARTVVLHGVGPVRPLFGEPTRAAILEDDARRRAVVLSTLPDASSDASVRAYLLYDFELERYLPRTMACAGQRRCAQDRTPGVGGLACVAVCMVEALRQ